MADISEFTCNNKLCDNQDSVLKNHEEPIVSLDFLLNWSPKEYYLNVEELKASKGYKATKEIEMDELQDESNTILIKEQLYIRDNLINLLYQYFEKVFSISQQSQIKLKELNIKKKELLKRNRLLKQRIESKKIEEKDDYENVEMEVDNSHLIDESPAEMNTENIIVAAPKIEIFTGNITEFNAISSDKNIPKVENSNQNCDKIVEKTVENTTGTTATTGTTDLNWNTLDVKEEVKELAMEVTEKLGFAYIKELDMFYDHSSGYYYDQKTSLYYDGKTGTYFFFNFETGLYEFHSQVAPSSTNEKEEGEGSDIEEIAQEENEDDDIEIAPSLRLMVMNGDTKGNLHVVTIDGGKIGREGDLQVLIKNPTVSKVHAEITYRCMGPYDHHYYLQDLGSNNGTFLRGQRLSEAKEASDIHEIGHGFEIKFGDVILNCHMHPGKLTCRECEPGLVTVASGETIKIVEIEGPLTKLAKKEKERRRQNKAIRKKLALNYFEPAPAPINNSKYKDRAAERRVTVGSDNPYEKTQVASIHTNIKSDNKGFKLMEKMGWSEGQKLGINDTGLIEPVVPATQTGREGFGCRTSSSSNVGVNSHSNRSIQQRILAHSKMMMNSTSSAFTSKTSEKTKKIKPIQFIPSFSSNKIT